MSVINTNVSALIAQVNLNATGMSLSQSIQRLSSGLRINTASDDAAGLAISEQLQSQVNGTQQAVRNSQDGVSMVQTADGALNQMQSILQRMNELAVEASNSDLNSTDRNAIQLEMNQLTSSIDSISNNAEFNGLRLLGGQLSTTYATASTQINSTDPNFLIESVDLTNAAPNTSYTLSVCTFNGTVTYASPTITQTIHVRDMNPNDTQVLNFNALGISIELETPPQLIFENSVSATEILSGLVGSNFTTDNTQGSATFQVGVNDTAFDRYGANFLQVDSANLGLTAATVNVSTTIASGMLINTIQQAIITVSNQRTSLAAIENSLNDTISDLNTADENLQAANSRIVDLDVASETVNFTKEQILQQAGTSVLAQANVLPQSVLTLLR